LDRIAPQKHVWRANIILATADGCGTAEIMRRVRPAPKISTRYHPKERLLSMDVERFDSLAEHALDMCSSWNSYLRSR